MPWSDIAPARPRAVVLLGTQRFDRVLAREVKGLEVDGRIALITAGWQEREAEDEELRAHLGTECVNLRLHSRAEEVFSKDPELREAHQARQQVLRHKQDFYRIRLEHDLEATHVIHQRHAPEDVLEEEEEASLASIRALDAYHLAQCERVHAAFEGEMGLAKRPEIKRHREELATLLEGCAAVAIAGGHVVSLSNRLRLFGLSGMLGGQVVFAWSGGAMAISERIVLFHDNPPQGPGAAEVLDRGLSLVPDLVVLPQPETRLRLDDPERVGLLARRFAPARCLAFPTGSHVTWRNGGFERPHKVTWLLEDGDCTAYGGAA